MKLKNPIRSVKQNAILSSLATGRSAAVASLSADFPPCDEDSNNSNRSNRLLISVIVCLHKSRNHDQKIFLYRGVKSYWCNLGTACVPLLRDFGENEHT